MVSNQKEAERFCLLKLKAPGIAREAKPGQFVMVYLPGGHQQILPRPLSISGVNRNSGELYLFFAVSGGGTELLAESGPGSCCRLLGPLGSGFPSPSAGSVLAAGGMGIAPLSFMATDSQLPLTLIYGARRAEQLIYPPGLLHRPGLTIVEVTEDGSRGEVGTVIDHLPRFLPGASALFSCGPRGMLLAAANISRQRNIPAWVSLEERMACGLGACLGCVVETSGGNRRVCCDGPVFAAGEVFRDV